MHWYRSIIYSLALLCVLCMPFRVNAAETLSVQVKESEIRATPSFLGKIVVKVVYGDRVTVTGTTGSWKKVSLKGGTPQGWIHSSALTTKRIVLQSGQANVQTGATQNELALAGKGFNDQVEASFMNQNKKLDYEWINRMETFKVTPDLMNTFLARGEVSPSPEGGVQ
jgi:SH3-like domain-containing protein